MNLSIFNYEKIMNCELLIEKNRTQKPIFTLIASKISKPISIVIIVGLFISGTILAHGVVLLIAAVLTSIISLMVLSKNKFTWLYTINTCNYTWFWKGSEIELTKQTIEDEVSFNSLIEFLNNINTKNWYVKNHKLTIDINDMLKSVVEYILVFRYKKDAIQCKLVI